MQPYSSVSLCMQFSKSIINLNLFIRHTGFQLPETATTFLKFMLHLLDLLCMPGDMSLQRIESSSLPLGEPHLGENCPNTWDLRQSMSIKCSENWILQDGESFQQKRYFGIKIVLKIKHWGVQRLWSLCWRH